VRDFSVSDVEIQDSAATEMPNLNNTNNKLSHIYISTFKLTASETD